MARPLNSTKPLYTAPIIKAGRPATAKLTIGYIGPSLEQSTADDLAQAVLIGQCLAEQRHIAAIFAEAGTTTALIRGIRDKSGVVIGFSASKNYQQLQQDHDLPQLDTVIYTGQSAARQKLFIESLDALIIHTYVAPHIQLNLPLPNTIPVGVLINNRESAQQVSYIANLAQPSLSPIDYSDNPRQLVNTIIKQAKSRP